MIAQTAALQVTNSTQQVQRVCFRQTGRTTTIANLHADDPTGDGSDAKVHAIADRYVAYRWTFYSYDVAIIHMRVLDARSGKKVTDPLAFRGARDPQPKTGYEVTGAALAPNGTVAWSVVLPDWLGDRRELRWARRGAGISTLVSTSPTIEPGSVALNHRYLYWRDANTAMSVPLEPR
jgi:hypothetical protein